eukprot:g39668.t1
MVQKSRLVSVPVRYQKTTKKSGRPDSQYRGHGALRHRQAKADISRLLFEDKGRAPIWVSQNISLQETEQRYLIYVVIGRVRVEQIAEMGVTTGTGHYTRPVINVTTGHVYPSIKAAADAMGLRPTSIWQALKCGYRSAGFLWCYVDDGEISTPKTKIKHVTRLDPCDQLQLAEYRILIHKFKLKVHVFHRQPGYRYQCSDLYVTDKPPGTLRKHV